jgi:hypothetical protein
VEINVQEQRTRKCALVSGERPAPTGVGDGYCSGHIFPISMCMCGQTATQVSIFTLKVYSSFVPAFELKASVEPVRFGGFTVRGVLVQCVLATTRSWLWSELRLFATWFVLVYFLARFLDWSEHLVHVRSRVRAVLNSD